MKDDKDEEPKILKTSHPSAMFMKISSAGCLYSGALEIRTYPRVADPGATSLIPPTVVGPMTSQLL